MSLQPNQPDGFPSDWAQLYALAYAELCTVVESFLDGDLSKAEMSDHYRHHVNRHFARVEHVCEHARRALAVSIDHARQE